MKDEIPNAKVTLVADVGATNNGNNPIRLEIRTSTANVITTGKYFMPWGPMMSVIMSRTAKMATSRVCCPLLGSSSERRPFKIQIRATARTQAIRNMIVYQGMAFSGVYGPKAASGVDWN